MSDLVICGGCARHVRNTEAVCPFCGLGRKRSPSRAAVLLAGATVIVACGKTTADPGVPDGAKSTEDAGLRAAVPAYGAPPPTETAQPPLAYGPAVLRQQTCPPPVAPPRSTLEGCDKCQKDEYCFEEHVRGRKFGRCTKSTCQKDADCKGGLCRCGPPNVCVAGDCRGPEDCGGRDCATDRWRYGHGSGTFCRTKDDTCKTHDECGPDQECAFSGKWSCRRATPPPPPG